MSGHHKARVDDDDLDDLDDVLDQFPSSTQPTSPPPQTASASAAAPTQPAVEVLSDDFADRLAEEMASLFKNAGAEPGTSSEGPGEVADRKRLEAAWEAMLVEELDTMSGRLATDAPSPGAKVDFQSRIQSTMDKRRERESDLESADSIVDAGSESFKSLLSQLQGFSGPSADGPATDEQIEGALEAIMGQLMSKDILYEPLKELHERFPEYLNKHSSTLSPEDKKRFDAQRSCVKKLLDEFEAKTYRDEDEKVRGKIVQLMGELQMHGSPPDEIMGPLPPGFTMGSDGLPNIPDCNVN